MEGEEGEGLRLSKRFSDKDGEVDYKTKSGTAWSHSYLNQKPWHPLSYPNQRRKWIAEQIHSQREKRAEEVAREYAQEQEFFRQTALISKKEKEKIEMMKAVSFMYVRPPGYNAESAKAAEIADEVKKEGQANPAQDLPGDMPSSSKQSEQSDRQAQEKKKPRPRDVFGRPLPTEEEFDVLKGAPKLDTGVPSRSKPFGVEVRNVRCVRCGNFGHQSGDRECPLKDVIMPNEESRLKRDDPLTAILAHTDPTEPLKWELKQKPGVSPPRGGFDPSDPNQQIVAEDIFDEYGGFLGATNIPDLLNSVSASNRRKKKSLEKRRKKWHSSPADGSRSVSRTDTGKRSNNGKKMHKKRKNDSEPSSSNDSEHEKKHRSRRHKQYDSPDYSDDNRLRSRRREQYDTLDDSDNNRHRSRRHKQHDLPNDSDKDKHRRRNERYDSPDDSNNNKHRSSRREQYDLPDDSGNCRGHSRRHERYDATDNSDDIRHHRSKRRKQKWSHSTSSEEDLSRHQSYDHERSRHGHR
ncbi:hypothetical protein MLD38_010434 [Melastoma candidum]|uniref:Uncharacterized protein n=1 Tax=Melastoma candidum TaxID=119954 RepID=A0ACB9QZY7_9MYRT|nr:hypothetical protein MLD38_010434 [Melastoma candidum]